jgi:hypothetical protein
MNASTGVTASASARRGVLGPIDDWLFAPGTESRLDATITLFAALIGLRTVLSPFRGLGAQPGALFDPPPFLAFLTHMPSARTIAVVQVIGAAAALLAVLHRQRRLTFFLAWVALLVLGGLRASRGKIMHNDVLLLMACVPLLAAPRTSARAWRARGRLVSAAPSVRFGWPWRASLVVVAGAYFCTGFHKLSTSGVRWVTSDNMRNVMYEAANGVRTHAPDAARWIGDHALVAYLVAAATLAFELGFPLVLWRPGARPWFAVAAVAFHAGTWALIGLDYWMWAATAVVVLVDWDRMPRGFLLPSGDRRAGSPVADAGTRHA